MKTLADISQFESLSKPYGFFTVDNSYDDDPVWKNGVGDPDDIREDAEFVSIANDPSAKIEKFPIWLHVEFRNKTGRYLPHHRGEESAYIEADTLKDEIENEPPSYFVELEKYARARAPLYEKWLKRCLMNFDKVTKECIRIANVVDPIPYVDEALGKPQKDENELRDRFANKYAPWGYNSLSLKPGSLLFDHPSTIKELYEQLEKGAEDKVERALNPYMTDGELLPFLDYLERHNRLRFMPNPTEIIEMLRNDDRFGSVGDADQPKYLKEDVTQYLDKQSKSILGRIKNLLSGKQVDYKQVEKELKRLLGDLRYNEDYLKKLLRYRGSQSQ